MPNIKSAKKRMRSSESRRVNNLAVKTRVKSAKRKATSALDAGVAADADVAVREYSSVLDKAAKVGVIKQNTATRRKKRATAALRKIEA